MNNTKTLTSANRFKLVLSHMSKVVRDRNQIDDFLDAVPNIINHILLNESMGIFTKEEAVDLIKHILSLKEGLF